MNTSIATALPVPWQPSKGSVEPTEAEFLAWLDTHGISYAKEAHLFRLKVGATGRSEGFAPDALVYERPGEWGQQYIEFTASANKKWQRYKLRRCNLAMSQYGARVILLLAAPLAAHDTPPRSTLLYWAEVKENPRLLLDSLRDVPAKATA